MINTLISSFNAGELSPYLQDRVSLDKYRNGCLLLENMYPTIYGTAHRRPGTQYIGNAGSQSTRSRLHGLNFNESNTVVMEIGVGFIHFWRGEQQITTANAVPVDYTGVPFTTVPAGFWYTEDELRSISILQINSVVYLAHPNHPPLRLTYTSDSNVTIGEIPYRYAPVQDVNVTTTTVTPSARTGNVFLYPSDGVSSTIFQNSDIGSYFQLQHLNPVRQLYFSLATSSTTTPLFVKGNYTVQTYNYWNATVYVEQKSDDGVWYAVKNLTSSADANFTFGSSIPKGGYVRCRIVTTTPTTGSPNNGKAVLEPADGVLTGQVRITGRSSIASDTTVATTVAGTTLTINQDYAGNLAAGTPCPLVGMPISGGNIPANTTITAIAVNGTTGKATLTLSSTVPISASFSVTFGNNANCATGIVTQTLGDTIPTGMWSRGAFSVRNGYPSAVGLFEGRVFYGGTLQQPNTIWGSASDDFQQFLLSTLASDAVTFTLSTTSAGRIQWFIGKSSMIIGTTSDEWAVSGSSGAINAANIVAKLQSRYGSTSLTPLVVNETLLFFQRGNRKVREMSYNFGVDAWVSPDLTVLSEQSVRKGILERAYTRVPDGTMWLVTADGGLTNMVYERDQQVAAFARHFTDGIIESVATVNGSGGEDEVWISVKRTIKASDGVTDINQRYIEKLRLGVRTAVETADKSGWWFSDSAKLVTSSTPFSTITGLNHLEGKTVQVWGDNAVVAITVNPVTGKYVVKNGTIYLGESVSRAIVGLPYTSKLAPMRVEHELNDGSSVGRRSRIPRIKVRVMNSLGGEFSSDNTTWSEMLARTTTDKMDVSPTPWDTFELLSVGGNWTYTPNLYLRQNLPMPLSVVSIVVLWETAENIRD